jgi:AAA+ superfamily predicted ATPase
LLASAASHQVDCLEQWARARIRNGKWPALHLVGPPGAGKGASARALCDRLGLKLFVLDPAVLELTPADLDEFLPTIDRDGILLEFAVYCDLTKIELNGPPGAAAVAAQRFNRLGILRIAGSRNPLGLDDALSVSITKPDAAAQSALWRVALNGSATALSGRIDLLVQQFDFGPQQIAEAAAATRESLELSHPLDDDTGAEALLWQSCRARAGNRLEDLAQRIQPAFGWDDIVVADDVMGQLREIAAQVELRPLVYGRWGFGERLSRGRGITALFAGPSGTGKTMAAEVLANALRLDLYRVDLASVVSKYIGETEKNLRRIFDAAEDGGVILFFDEADALFGKRSDVKDSHDRYANIEISYLLQRMEAYQGLAVLATNMKAILDQAFFRRIRFVVNFPFPDATQRAEIWRRMFPATAPTYGLELARLSRLNVAGGSIRNIALNAAFLAAKADQPICMTHVLEAARAEYAKLEKPLTDAEFRGCI